MNWLDYLRGYEEGRYDRTASGQGPGLPGAWLALALALLFMALAVCWVISKSITALLGRMIRRTKRVQVRR